MITYELALDEKRRPRAIRVKHSLLTDSNDVSYVWFRSGRGRFPIYAVH